VLFLSSWVNDLPVKPMIIHPAAKKQHEKEVRALQQEITDLKGKLEPFILGQADDLRCQAARESGLLAALGAAVTRKHQWMKVPEFDLGGSYSSKFGLSIRGTKCPTPRRHVFWRRRCVPVEGRGGRAANCP
jgi:hypothetical protein